MDQFCLKWNNYQTSLIAAFGNLQSTEELADVTLTCEAQTIKAHKIILSACSPYFRKVFIDNPCSHPIVILKDVSYGDLLAILNFMYHGEVLIMQDKLPSFLQTAELLQVSGLVHNTGLYQSPPNCAQNRDDQTKTRKKSKKSKKQGSERKFEVLADSTKIKSEVSSLDDVCTNNNTNENPDAYDKQGSILEAALEVKDGKENQPSILERSLTLQATQQTIIEETNLEIDKKGIKNKAHDVPPVVDQPQKIVKYEDDSSTASDEISITNPKGFSELHQPHHSSQCGNCPHCGKVYSNQSALKYHVRLVHSDLTNTYCCHICPEAFDFRESYKKHMADVHSVRN